MNGNIFKSKDGKIIVKEQKVRLLHVRYYLNLLRTANELYKEGGENMLVGLQQFDREWLQIKVGQAWAAMNIPKVDKSL